VVLVPHPHSPRFTSTLRVRAAAALSGTRLELEFVVDGEIARLRWPAPVGSVRADQLWQHSCFEAFVAAPVEAPYCELNFAPSGAWAAYRFAAYRRDLRLLELDPPPEVAFRSEPARVALRAGLDLAELLGGLAMEGRLRVRPPEFLELALSAVIEDDAGELSYWALSHRSERPDFHAREGFTARVAVPEAASPTEEPRP
jgi:hypothetical protein